MTIEKFKPFLVCRISLYFLIIIFIMAEVGNSLENEVDLMVVDGYGLFDLMARCS
jgi:hypothetical protein